MNADYGLGLFSLTQPESRLCGDIFLTGNFVHMLKKAAGQLFDDIGVLEKEFWAAALQKWRTSILPLSSPHTLGAPGGQTFRLSPAAVASVSQQALQTHGQWVENKAIPLSKYDVHYPSRPSEAPACLTISQRRFGFPLPVTYENHHRDDQGPNR